MNDGAQRHPLFFMDLPRQTRIIPFLLPRNAKAQSSTKRTQKVPMESFQQVWQCSGSVVPYWELLCEVL